MLQPGVLPGQQTYCPVSGVVLTVKADGARRDLDGTPIYFCCEKCATYFDLHRERVLAARGLTSTR